MIRDGALGISDHNEFISLPVGKVVKFVDVASVRVETEDGEVIEVRADALSVYYKEKS